MPTFPLSSPPRADVCPLRSSPRVRYTKTEYRKEGATAGTYDTYFFSPQQKRFRSRAEIARYFSLEAAPRASSGGKSQQEKQQDKANAKEAKMALKEADRGARDAQLEYARSSPLLTTPCSHVACLPDALSLTLLTLPPVSHVAGTLDVGRSSTIVCTLWRRRRSRRSRHSRSPPHLNRTRSRQLHSGMSS